MLPLIFVKTAFTALVCIFGGLTVFGKTRAAVNVQTGTKLQTMKPQIYIQLA